ncbi:MAG TPA: alpha/beta fold hydrolase [Terriglobales bacterium]|jgi:carboxylesterase|nr:alpha/beta fold hydrolase [Terriglobales bacterium]
MSEAILPKPFDGDEHRSFFWQRSESAALLVHGFPGTPAEMRPLGAALRDAGWTVHGLMLPGLGADIANLEQRGGSDWSDAVHQTLGELQQSHSPVLLVGYSMGGALALNAAGEQRPDGLILLAPFWSFGENWLSLLWPAIRLILRRVRPLSRADFSVPEVRRSVQRMFGNIDLDDPETQKALRNLTASTKPIEQLSRLGKSAFNQAAKIDAPTLVIQGSRDHVVPPLRTRRLLNNFIRSPEYHEVDAGHDLVDPQSGAWDQVREALLRFAISCISQAKGPARLHMQ